MSGSNTNEDGEGDVSVNWEEHLGDTSGVVMVIDTGKQGERLAQRQVGDVRRYALDWCLCEWLTDVADSWRLGGLGAGVRFIR